MASTVYSIIRAYNPDLLLDAEQTFLDADVAASVGTLTVRSITAFGVGDYILLGEFGQEDTEILRVHTSTAPSGTTITLATNTTIAHKRGTVIYRIEKNRVEFS